MKKTRVIETNEGIKGEIMSADYDEMQRDFRDRGIIETKEVINSGINSGEALEIGPGPGYLGLEWLKNSSGTRLTGLDISEDMKKLAEKNAKEYGLEKRTNYIVSDAKKLPFPDNSFDGVFTNGSLHEWAEPVKIFNEIKRVLKKGGRFYIGDLKRNINPLLAMFMKFMVKKKAIKQGLTTSINAAYTKNELSLLFENSELKNFKIIENAFGLTVTGQK